MISSQRAQSQTVGVLLMTGIVIVLMGSLGVAMTLNLADQMESGPQIDLDGSATKEYVTLEHAGGERLEVSELDVVLRSDSTERYDLTSFTQRRGDDATWFEPGDWWRREHGLSGDSVEVLLVHTPSGTVAGRTVLELAATGPFFEVDVTDTNSPVEEGETLKTNVTVENTGIAAGTQDLEFSFNGTVEGTRTVTLSPGKSTTTTFTKDTSSVTPDTYTVEASTDNRTDQETVTVTEKQANITITEVGGLPDETTNHTYRPNVTVTESANVETDGLAVELILEKQDNETTVFEETKTAQSGDFGEIRDESLTVNFDVGQLDASNYNYFATASATNAVTDGESGGFAVGEPAFFNVTIEDTNSPVNAGNNLTVDATINNTGGVESTQAIVLTIEGATEDSQTVTLAAGENRTITLEWRTEKGDQNGSPYNATVSSNDDSDTVQVTVDSPGGGSIPPTVETRAATDIDASSATLNGNLTDLGTANNVDVYFEYRETGTNTWTSTASETQRTTGTFSETVTGLNSGTQYAFRAVAESNDGSDTGDTLTFTTDNPPEFNSVAASDIGDGNSVTQTFTFELSSDVVAGDEVEINLDNAYDTRGGQNTDIIYPDSEAEISSNGAGTLSIVSASNQEYSIIYTVGGNDAGSEVEITVGNIDTSQANQNSYTADFILDREGVQQDSASDGFNIIG